MQEGKIIKQVIIEYEDGSMDILEKGLVAQPFVNPKTGKNQLVINTLSMSPQDIGEVVRAISPVAASLGVLNKKENSND